MLYQLSYRPNDKRKTRTWHVIGATPILDHMTNPLSLDTANEGHSRSQSDRLRAVKSAAVRIPTPV